MTRINRLVAIVLAIFILSSILFGQEQNNRLIIFHAGSLTVPFEKIIDGFKKENPNVEVIKEIAGSRACARKISELHKECDIMASADYKVIDNLLIPTYALWNIKFATNEMAIVYTEHSRKADEINRDNWYDVMLGDDISIGRSDPNVDPCGYRAVLTMKLAESYYNQPGLANKLIAKDNEYIRPKETDLIALLEAGELDYIFLYRSVAEQHGLKFLILPDEINLKRAELQDEYKKVSVEISGKNPGEKIVQHGDAMVYGFTIPKNSPNPELAQKFVQYFLDKNKGLKILEELGQPTIIPSYSETYKFIPDDLKQYATDKM